jgi:hypothetical protein
MDTTTTRGHSPMLRVGFNPVGRMLDPGILSLLALSAKKKNVLRVLRKTSLRRSLLHFKVSYGFTVLMHV